MARAIWNGELLAESDDTILIEGNYYCPPESLVSERFRKSDHRTHCPWKGDAAYFDLIVAGERNENAAWYYPSPLPAAEQIRGRVAFWRGVAVEA